MDDTKLLMYLDGLTDQMADPLIESESQERLRELRQQQQLLGQLFYRVECPNSLTVAEYQAGLLEPRAKKQFEQHLPLCPHCSRELVAMRRFMAMVSPELADGLFVVPEKPSLQVIFARLLGPATFQVRGGAKEEPLVYEAGDFQVTIEVTDDISRPGHKMIFGLIVADAPAGWQVVLSQNGQQIAATISTDFGNFEVKGLKPGGYDCVVTRPEYEIHLPTMTI